MKKISTAILFLALAVVIGGGIFVTTWDFPAPSTPVNEVLPDDRFPR